MTIALDKPDETWDFISQCLDEFLSAWGDSANPPQFDKYLPREPAWLRQLALAELVKIDMEQRQAAQCWKPLEDYVSEFPELCTDGMLPDDLIYEEYYIRKSAGEDVALDEYQLTRTQPPDCKWDH